MAKRTNPFVEDFIPQSKTHIGIKQFNNNEVRLQKVYGAACGGCSSQATHLDISTTTRLLEKTLQLLFKGAKKIPVHGTDNNSDLNGTKKDNMKQLFIGKDGCLLHSGSMVKNSVQSKECCCGVVGEVQCAYCEAALCGGCQHCCDRCNHPYCSHCSLIGCDGAEVCVSCYG